MKESIRKTKILHVVNISFVINHFFGNQFSHFAGKGYKFYVACTPDENFYKEAKSKGFTPIPLSILRSISPINDIISIWKLYRILKKEKIDVVVAHSPKGGLVGMVAAYLAGIDKRVFFRHGLVFETASGWKKWLLVSIERFTSLIATKVINVSQSIIQVSNQHKLNDPNKNYILGNGTCNGVDLTRFYPQPKHTNAFVVGYVGRICKDKGIEPLVEAWKAFSKERNNVELHLIGPFDDRDAISNESILEIANNPTIIHFDFTKDTSKYYPQMDVFILPSYREGFGMVILEASASGIPVITTRRTGCINAIVENVTGIFTDITSRSIKESIDYYYQNPELRRQHGNNGVAFVRNHFEENLLFEEIELKVFN